MGILKRIVNCSSSMAIVTMLLVNPAAAQDLCSPAAMMLGGGGTEGKLTCIALATNAILTQLNTTPAYIQSITEMAMSWLDTNDSAKMLSNNQANFALLGSSYNALLASQISVSQGLSNNFLGLSSYPSTTPTPPDNAGDLTYSAVLNIATNPLTGLPTPGAVAHAQNYIADASGANLILKQANPNWRTSYESTQYKSIFNSMAAIQSYDAFLISGLYNTQAQDAAAKALADQASGSAWFTQVASESLGLVFRQLLMYSSMQYVQIDRLLKLQQEQLAVQAMTNVLLITLVQGNIGSTLYGTASRQ